MNTTDVHVSEASAPEDVRVQTFSLPIVVHFLQYLHRIWTTTAFLAVPEEKTLGSNVPMDETTNGRAERLLLVGSWQKVSV